MVEKHLTRSTPAYYVHPESQENVLDCILLEVFLIFTIKWIM